MLGLAAALLVTLGIWIAYQPRSAPPRRRELREHAGVVASFAKAVASLSREAPETALKFAREEARLLDLRARTEQLR